MEMLALVLVVWAAFVLLGMYVASQKGRSGYEAMLICALFGPFGVLVVALLPTLEIPRSALKGVDPKSRSM